MNLGFLSQNSVFEYQVLRFSSFTFFKLSLQQYSDDTGVSESDKGKSNPAFLLQSNNI